MPKLNNRNPKLGKNGNYAVVRYKGKTHRLGRYGSPEALTAYNRFCAELQSNPTGYVPPSGEPDVSVRELAVAFLDHLKARTDEISYITYRIIIDEFLLELYPNTPADEFSTTCLDLVRGAMKQSERFNRDVLNRHTRVRVPRPALLPDFVCGS